MSATSERDLAIRIAKTDFAKALPLARNVSRPWSRCQTLAFVARYGPEEQVVKIAAEAMAAASKCDDVYQRVAAQAWPLRALIERDQVKKAASALPPILELSGQIEHPTSRSDALFLLWQAVFPLGGAARDSVTGALTKSCLHHSKGHYILRDVALILAVESPEKAQQIADSTPAGKYQRQTQKRLTEGQKMTVREFFF